MTKKIVSFSVALVLLLSVLSVFSFSSASAANACTQISGSSARSTTFKVYTGSRWLFSDKITLTQTQGYLKNLFGLKIGSFKAYDTFSITVRKISTGKTTYYTMKNGSVTTKLDKNSTYSITVTPASSSTLQSRYWCKGYIMGWNYYAHWSVKSTKGIISCS